VALPRVVHASEPYLTASVLVVRDLLSYARSHGVDVDRLLSELGILPALLEDPDARVPQATLERAWAEVSADTGDEALGLHAAQHSAEGAFEVLDYAMYFSSTLRDAVDRIDKFYRLLADVAAIEVVRDGDATHVRRLVFTHPQAQDFFFAFICVRLRAGSGREIRPREVCFEHAPHAQAELSEFFRCPIRFGRAQSDLVLASADLALPVQAAKPRLAAVLDRYAEELLERLPSSSSYVDHVRRAIAHVIKRGPPTLEAVAREMHASARTFQRRLAEAGTTYQRQVDEVRHHLALRCIKHPHLSIVEIAFLLGFRDESSFRRSFRKWTGRSPTQARKS
jgi:AraC-like DNA-binding protein